jgi:hypothetical protein
MFNFKKVLLIFGTFSHNLEIFAEKTIIMSWIEGGVYGEDSFFFKCFGCVSGDVCAF